ncbi:MAG: nucleotide sugar dehydrogenase [Anaerolineae bacterium]
MGSTFQSETNRLSNKIQDKSAVIAVIGIGYVGLPLAVAFAEAGYSVTGVDLDSRKVEAINHGDSYIPDVSSETLRALRDQKRIQATSDPAVLRRADVIFICVPTPFDAMKAPDLTAVRMAAQSIQPHLHHDQLIILQSTTYPGTTEEVVQPILEASGLKAGKDFHLAFSPERIDPGAIHSAGWNVKNTPKVLGGLTPESTELARQLLTILTPQVCVVSSPRTAEMSKLLENIFRSVNIALVNELALLCERMGIDIWEVIDAARTKPFGFMPFYPSAGVGGHCIPVDPYYLSWKAREFDFYTKFIELAAEVNQSMPFHAVNLVGDALSRAGKPLAGAQVLILGVAFKRDIDDARNSPAERVVELLLSRGAQVSYHDPYVPGFHVGGSVFYPPSVRLESRPLTAQAIAGADVVMVVTGHHVVDYTLVANHAGLIVDTTNVMAGIPTRATVVRLGAPNSVRPTNGGLD